MVCYSPSDSACVYGGERVEGQSSFDPFAADFAAYPLARRAVPHAAVLLSGDTLMLPRGWWLAARPLQPTVALRREWVSPGPHAQRFQALLRAQEKQAATAVPHRVAGVELPAPEIALENDPDVDIFVVRAARAAHHPSSHHIACRHSRALCQRAAAHRTRGNGLFSCGRVREACEAYSAAIDLLTLRRADEAARVALQAADVQEACAGDEAAAAALCACLANRAACWLRRKQWSRALQDCNAVLRAGRPYDDVTVKALFRRAKAHEGLGDADAAQADFRRVLELQPSNADAQEQLELYRSVLHRIVVMSYGDEDVRRRQKGGL